MKRFLFLILLFPILSFSSVEHDIHLSVCDIEQNQNQTVEITFNIFFDDLQSAMGLRPGEELPKKYKGSDALITEFLEANFNILVDGKKADWQYDSSFLANPSVWTTLFLKDIDLSKIKKIEVVNSIMLSMYKDQKNIVNFNLQGKKKTFLLDRKKTSAKIFL